VYRGVHRAGGRIVVNRRRANHSIKTSEIIMRSFLPNPHLVSTSKDDE
jgi:hypothetical protein